MALREIVVGHEAFRVAVKKLYKETIPLFIYLFGKKSHTGESWCPQCITAEPFIQEAVKNATMKMIFLEVDVGNREEYYDSQNPFRLDTEVRLKEIPTLICWKTPKRLDGVYFCSQPEILKLFFTNEVDY